MQIVQHYPASVKEYVRKIQSHELVLPLPKRCPNPECREKDSLVRWGYYNRWMYTATKEIWLRIQRVRCQACGGTHSLLPDFVHPYRRYSLELLQLVILLYVLMGLSWTGLLDELAQEGDRHPARSTVREWVGSFVHGAGTLLLERLRRHLMRLAPRVELQDAVPPRLDRVRGPGRRQGLRRAYHFWLIAEQTYAQVKVRLPRLHFQADQVLAFMLHWLQLEHLPPRLFWCPRLPKTPQQPF